MRISSVPRTRAFVKLLEKLNISPSTKPDIMLVATVEYNKTDALTNKNTYNISFTLADIHGTHIGDAIASGTTSYGVDGCVFHEHASTICFHNKGTLSIFVTGTNVTDSNGLYNQPGTYIVGKIVNGSGQFLGYQGYVIAQIIDEKTRNNYFYFTKDASQSEVDCLKSQVDELQKLVITQSAQIGELTSRLNELNISSGTSEKMDEISSKVDTLFDAVVDEITGVSRIGQILEEMLGLGLAMDELEGRVANLEANVINPGNGGGGAVDSHNGGGAIAPAPPDAINGGGAVAPPTIII